MADAEERRGRQIEVVSEGTAGTTKVLLPDGTDLVGAMLISGISFRIDVDDMNRATLEVEFPKARVVASIQAESAAKVLDYLLEDDALFARAAAALAARATK